MRITTGEEEHFSRWKVGVSIENRPMSELP